ncbi:MAG: methionyl-tRNA formyltransferase [Candidatus Aquicultorales bacterium]
MRVIFMGTPDFSVPTLKALHAAGHDIALVVSQPDKPVGRGLKTKPTPVRQEAEDLGLPLEQPEGLKDEVFRRKLESIAPDVIVVAAFGRILPKWLLDLPKQGCLNVHGSILPGYRGAAPIQRAVMDGVKETGVTIMRMDEGMDTGGMFLVAATDVGPEETAGEVYERLARMGAEAMVEVLDRLSRGAIEPQPQDEALATYAPKIEKSEGEIDWGAPTRHIADLVRGLNPAPVAYTYLGGRRVRVHRARPVETGKFPKETGAAPGTVVALHEEGPVVACGDGTVVLTEVQPEGKKIMAGSDYARGRYVRPGDRYGHD